MLENSKYKNENYINFGNISAIKTVGELKYFLSINMHLKEDEIFNAIKSYLPVNNDDTYIKSLIKKEKRKIKINNLLKNEG